MRNEAVITKLKSLYDTSMTSAYEHLNSLPTLAVGQADDLKYDDGKWRLWLSRTGLADGEPFEHTITVERRYENTWLSLHEADGDATSWDGLLSFMQDN